MTDIVVVGALHLDVIVKAPRLPAIDETLMGHEVRYALGGKAGNQAMAAVRHGAGRGINVQLAARIGMDDFGARMRRELEASRVDLTFLQTDETRPSGMSVATVNADGDYGAVVVSGANTALDPDALRLSPDTRCILLQNEVPESVNLAIAQQARDSQAIVLLNAAPAWPLSRALLACIDVLVVNRTEASTMAERSCNTLAEAQAIAGELSSPSCAVIVTLGAEGCVICTSDREVMAMATHQVDVISSHGAGDCFMGALATQLACGETLASSCRYAQAAAALHVSTDEDARVMISPAQVQALMGQGDRHDKFI